jgi:acetolactate decarboxylase
MADAPSIRKFAADEWRPYRDLRLRALADSPDAFGSTLAAEAGYPDAEWARRLAASADVPVNLPLVAEMRGELVGLAWGRIVTSAPDVAALYQMWVAPAYRGRAAGQKLLEAVIAWATAQHAASLDLSVTCGDSPARRLYERAGFKPLGEPQPLRPGSTLLAQPMRLMLKDTKTMATAPRPEPRNQGAPPAVSLSCRISQSLSKALHARSEATGESVDHLVRAALADYLRVEHGTLFQVSTAGALVAGLYHGEVTVGDLREHGDFGLGTFEALDGEMVVLDGHFYQVRGDGTVAEVAPEVRSPYAMVTRFPAGGEVNFADCRDLASLHAQLDRLRDSQNVFYAVRVDGEFDAVQTRSVRPTPEGVPLVQAASRQQEYQLAGVRGTLVGFWSPGYLQTILVPGYHLHFLSDDRRTGGHLLGCAGRQLRARVRREADFRISLPESASFL